MATKPEKVYVICQLLAEFIQKYEAARIVFELTGTRPPDFSSWLLAFPGRVVDEVDLLDADAFAEKVKKGEF